MSYTESLSASGYVIEGIAGFALLPSVDGKAQTATAGASPFFLPVSLTPSATSVSLTLESALGTGKPASGTGTSASSMGAFTMTSGAAGFDPTLTGTSLPSGTSLPDSNGAITNSVVSYSFSVAVVMCILVGLHA